MSEFGPSYAELAQLSPNMATGRLRTNFRSSSGLNQATFDRHRPNFAESRPNLAEIRPNPVEIAQVWPKPAPRSRTQAKFDKHRTELAEFGLAFGRSRSCKRWPHDQLRAGSNKTRGISTKIEPCRPNIKVVSTNLGRVRPKLAWLRPILRHVDQHQCGFGQTWHLLGQIWQDFGKV